MKKFQERHRAHKKWVTLGKTRAQPTPQNRLTPERDRGIAFLKHLKTIGDRR